MLTIKVFHFWFCYPNDVNNIKPEKQEVFIRQCFASDLALFIKRDVCSTPQSTGLIEYWRPVTSKFPLKRMKEVTKKVAHGKKLQKCNEILSIN